MRPSISVIWILAALLTASLRIAAAEETLKLEDENARINYSLGYQIGSDFKDQAVTLNPQAVIKGMQDALSANKPAIAPAEMNRLLVDLKRRVIAGQQEKRRVAELQRDAAGKKFLAENAKKPGVITTASGLQYRIIKPGSGQHPGPTDRVTVNYRGTLINGQEFDSSYRKGKPITFPLNGVIRGWTEGLQLIRPGGRIKLFVPPALAYGNRGPLAHRTLVFDVELISAESASASGSASPGKPAVE